ncbi:filamentous hemagglutinin N-terminal domain-containing protein [Limnoraphis robusta]|uniref:Filamentous hemagglutinin N-terminal domain-containing protein n=1 Tax=Limnoraphis robusta CCNP1315 TaxID=3110306 RepID=A0ABU5TW26_9CYAN|nr:filamentous hemagglutinin N-terminal domain-containing protein [Limnoraphis robusta]MEA5519113.1 filamentous hemagglutinin N-terminal domain-containing protein [Limnoraphis robusta CCNP1315]MEA5548822.1 filamentous hemagglutinin N-terminal domain-containing protein [Limnoraphis robusta CCNP1324]
MFFHSVKLSFTPGLMIGISGFVLATSPSTALAQIVPDNTLGSENSVVTPNVNIRGINSDRIDGGAVRGSNLFHSFQEFNIREGRGAYFSNPDNIINILTRVTGGNISEILGTLGVLGNANLFLINPAGIVFGPNARLDVGGSFFATTADGILFENGFEFAASNPQAPPLLTINMPLGLNIRENPGAIVNQTLPQLVRLDESPLRNDAGFLIPQGLNVPRNQTLALVGGDVLFDGGFAISPGSRIQLGGLSEPGIIELTNVGANGNTPILQFPDNIQRGNVALTNESQINVRADGGGDVNINARNVEISGNSVIRVGIDNGLGSIEAEGGDVNINAQENVLITGAESSIRNVIDIDAIGQPGNINITANSLRIDSGAFLNTALLGEGNAGNINVQAASVEVSGTSPNGEFRSGFFANVNDTGMGNGGNIYIETGQLRLTDRAIITSSTFEQGNAGVVSILATDSVELSGSNILSSVAEGAVGNGGTVEINTGNLLLSEGSQIITNTSGQGDAGNITVKADNIEFMGTSADGELISAFFADVNETGMGNGGNIKIETGQLRLTDRARIQSNIFGEGNAGTIQIETGQLRLTDSAVISSSTFGQGNAGLVSISATDSVELSNSNIFSNVEQAGRGNGGMVEINTGNLFLSEGGRIFTSTLGQGNAGNITVKADNIELTGTSADGQLISGFFADVNRTGMGNGGNIQIETEQLRLTDGSSIQSNIFGQGNAGLISILATDSVELSNGAIFSSLEQDVRGNGGIVEINTGNLLLLEGGQILTRTFGQGNAGSIIVKADNIEFRGTAPEGLGSAFFASVEETANGNGGQIIIETQQLQMADASQINVSTSGAGNAGNITVKAENINLSGFGFSPEGEMLSTGFLAGSGSTGNAGTIIIEAEQLRITDSAGVSVASDNAGNAGTIIVRAANVELLDAVNNQGSSLIDASVKPTGTGSGGSVIIEAERLVLRNGGRIEARTANGEGRTGQILINASESVELSGVIPGSELLGSSLFTSTTGSADAGDITIFTGKLSIQDRSNISATSGLPVALDSLEVPQEATGNAGNIRIFATDSVELVGIGQGEFSIGISANTFGEGDGGNIEIQTGQLLIRNSLISASSQNDTRFNAGDAGNINIVATDRIELSGSPAGLSALTTGTGNGGDVTILTRQLTIRDGARISVGDTTSDNEEIALMGGNGGNTNITASESVELINNAQISSLTSNAGNAGNITVETGRFVMDDKSGISAGITSSGDAGDIAITAEQVSILDNSLIGVSAGENSTGNAGNINITALEFVDIGGTSTDGSGGSGLIASTKGQGDAGNVNITTGQLSVRDGGSIVVVTSGNSSGNAGNITITAPQQVELRGTAPNGNPGGLFAETRSTGNAGDVTIQTGQLQIRDQARILVNSTDSGIPGNINISANQTLLDNQGQLNASSEAGQGGNINLRSRDTRLFNQSLIQATGSQSGQTFEGNIAIDANLLILLGSSGIITDASNPTGGSNINIRPLGNSELGLLQSQNSTISAAGELSIDDTLNFDPPESTQVQVVDPAALIAQDPCKQRGDSQFIITGRGGIAFNPTQDLFAVPELELSLIEPVTPSVNRSSQRRSQQSKKRDNHPIDSRTIVPARGWIRDENGDVILVSYDPTKTGVQRQQPNPNFCQP